MVKITSNVVTVGYVMINFVQGGEIFRPF